MLGEKVDTIEWARKEILETAEALEKGRKIVWKGRAPWDEARHVKEATARATEENPADHEQGTTALDLDHNDLETQAGRPSNEKKGIFNTVAGVGEKFTGRVTGALDLESPTQAQTLEGEDAEKGRNMASKLKTAAGVVPVVGGLVRKSSLYLFDASIADDIYQRVRVPKTNILCTTVPSSRSIDK